MAHFLNDNPSRNVKVTRGSVLQLSGSRGSVHFNSDFKRAEAGFMLKVYAVPEGSKMRPEWIGFLNFNKCTVSSNNIPNIKKMH